MTVGPGRFRIRRAASASEGLVVQAVLLMAMVTTIGIFVVAARVAGSRQSAAAATLSNTARQAAEYGFTEIVAEMNRDSKSYLWVIDSANWNGVSEQDLINCGVASTNAPSSNPIPGVASNVQLPRSPGLSYKIISYKAPSLLDSVSPSPSACPRGGAFGNLLGGSGEITILGTFNRGPKTITSYTLKRTVSVKRAVPLYKTFESPPSSILSFDSSDPRFPSYPQISPGGSPKDIECEPDAPSLIKCSYDSSPPVYFSSSTDTSAANNFPYLPSGALWDACVEDVVGGKIQCLVGKLEIDANANMIVTTVRPTDKKVMPVEIFLRDNMKISSGARLSGDNWSRFRIFGASPGTSCGAQKITINPFNNTTNGTIESNLQNAFIWLKVGKLEFDSTIKSIPILVGSVCQSDVPSSAISTNISDFKLFEGLSAPYGLQGVFSPPPLSPPQLRFFYRGFGFSEQSSS